MTDQEPEDPSLWTDAERLVDDQGHLGEGEFGSKVAEYIARRPALDPDLFTAACVGLYVQRRRRTRLN